MRDHRLCLRLTSAQFGGALAGDAEPLANLLQGCERLVDESVSENALPLGIELAHGLLSQFLHLLEDLYIGNQRLDIAAGAAIG